MAVISIPEHEPWVVAGWAFRMLLEQVIDQLNDPEDKEQIEGAMPLKYLHFKRFQPAQAVRIAEAMEKTADMLRKQLLETSADPRDLSFADSLADLSLSLSDLRPE